VSGRVVCGYIDFISLLLVRGCEGNFHPEKTKMVKARIPMDSPMNATTRPGALLRKTPDNFLNTRLKGRERGLSSRAKVSW
jgi:hypothetical protein